MPKLLPNVGYVALRHMIAGHAGKVIVGAKPSLLQFMLKTALHDGMMGQFTHVNRTQSVNLRRNRIFFDQGFFGESEL